MLIANVKVSIYLLTDTNSLFDVTLNGSLTSEHRFRLTPFVPVNDFTALIPQISFSFALIKI